MKRCVNSGLARCNLLFAAQCIGLTVALQLYLFRRIIGVLADIGRASRAPVGFFNRGLTIEHYSTDMMIKADRHRCEVKHCHQNSKRTCTA